MGTQLTPFRRGIWLGLFTDKEESRWKRSNPVWPNPLCFKAAGPPTSPG